MKHFLYTLIVSAALLAAGCSEDKKEIDGASDLYGSVRISVNALAGVDAQTRATVDLPAEAIPAANAFALRITGSYTDGLGDTQSYNQSWETLSAYDSPKIPRGSYTAHISYGNADAEGPAAACFAGEQTFTILARQTISAEVNAALTNSACRLSFDEWFNRYYTDARITLSTESGHEFTFDKNTSDIIFVKPGTKLSIKGTATKAQTETPVEFSSTVVGTSAARTLHTITVKAAEAGAGKLEISFDDLFTELPEQVIELNPEA